MFFQGRGTAYLRELDADLNPGPAKIKICTDTLLVSLNTESWSHINKCGPVDVEDARGTTSNSGEITFTFANVEDKLFAFAALGLITAAGSPGTVTDEALPSGIEAGDSVFLGGKERHRAITALVLTDTGTPGGTLTLTTDYTLDAETGRVLFVTTPDGDVTASYGYTDPASVSLLTAGQKEYALDYEFINRQQANDKGSLELFRVRMDPVQNIDMQSDKEQNLSMKGSCLADTARDVGDTEFGPFGRRVL